MSAEIAAQPMIAAASPTVPLGRRWQRRPRDARWPGDPAGI